jgi:phosphoglycerate dehydrogenase-like enzyme
MARRRPRVVVLSGRTLFESFFDAPRRRRLSRLADWTRSEARRVDAGLQAELAAADGLVTTWDSPRFGEDLPALAPRLRVVAHCGGEVKGKFARPLFSRLVIANAPSPMAPYVAELALTFLLRDVRRVEEYREALRRPSSRIYQALHLRGGGRESLRGRTVGLVGFGHIGRAIAERLRLFGPRVLVYDPYVPRRLARAYGVTFSPLPRLLRSAEFLVLAAGLTDATRGMIDRRALSLLPSRALVVNIARGGLVDLEALTREVRRGRLRCALDVTDPHEPLPLRHPLRRLPGATVTPHVGAAALAVRRAMADIVLETLERSFSGRRLANRVTQAMLDRMT